MLTTILTGGVETQSLKTTGLGAKLRKWAHHSLRASVQHCAYNDLISRNDSIKFHCISFPLFCKMFLLVTFDF